ncbi:uncharacterized protein [Cherax quadricarinatus]|uniref:uncharacterized protein n=1 Tax=Cherax quadricarinatus TaxID=27406 RepID=UPI002379A196|nr:uncharacterized protein LOC128685120 [Cherax quadricarinatus]
MDLIREDLTERRLRFKSRVGRGGVGSLTDLVFPPPAGLSRQFHTAVTAVMAARYSCLSFSCQSTYIYSTLLHQPGAARGDQWHYPRSLGQQLPLSETPISI